MDRCGWPAIQHDGSLLVSHQDVLLMGGKVQAPAGYADHVVFRDIEVCRRCGNKLCVEMCSGQAITRSVAGVPNFDREKCIFCGACMWNCPETVQGQSNLQVARRRRRTALGRELARDFARNQENMSNSFQVVVCASVVPDPLQTLEPVSGPNGPALKNEMMLPAILDPWAAHALYEGANLVKQVAGSSLWLVSMAPKAKLQQVMMTVAQKVPLQLVAVDGPSSGFADAHQTATTLAAAVRTIPGIDLSKLLLFGGWESASRSAGVTLQLVGEELGIVDQFQGVDAITRRLMVHLRCWSASKVRGTRCRCALDLRPCWDGRPAAWASRATIRKSEWRTCGP